MEGAVPVQPAEGRRLRVLVACEFSGAVRDVFRARGWHAVSCDLLPSASPGLHAQMDVRHLLDGFEPVRFAAECDPDGDGWCAVADCDPAECACFGPTMDEDEVEYVERAGVLMARRRAAPFWDLLVAFPPCTYLTGAAEWAYGDGPYHQQPKPETLVGAARRAAREESLLFVRALMDAPVPFMALENPVGVIGTRIRKANQIVHPHQFGDDASKATCLWTRGLPPLVSTGAVAPRLVGGKPRWANQTDSGQNRLGPSADRWAKRSETYPGIAAAMGDQWGGFIERAAGA